MAQFELYLTVLIFSMDGGTDGGTDGVTDGRTDGRTDKPTYRSSDPELENATT